MALYNSKIKLELIQSFDNAYQLLEQSFPKAELRLYNQMKQLYKSKAFKLYQYKDKDILSLINIWEFNDFIYIEYLCVNKNIRSQGLGSRMLNEIQSVYKDKLIVLEVEKPESSEQYKRIEFYKKNNFLFNEFHYIQPPFRIEEEDVDLYLMSYPSLLTEHQFGYIKQTLFKNVYNTGV